MLHGAGKDLAEGITTLVDNQEKLKGIISEGVFDAKNISSMLHGAGKNLATGITAIQERMPKLNALATIFSPHAISQQLNTRTVRQLGCAIDQMFETHENEINGNTQIPKGSKPVIEFKSNGTKLPMQRMHG